MDKLMPLLSTKEAARFLRISPSTLYRMEKMGYILPYRTPGGQRRFRLKDLEEYLRKSKGFQYNNNKLHYNNPIHPSGGCSTQKRTIKPRMGSDLAEGKQGE